MRWLIVLALLMASMPVSAQGGLDIGLSNGAFSYGPEDWKDVDSQRPPMWNASLGLRYDVDIAVDASGQAMTDWDFEATLSDGATTVVGQLGPIERGSFHARFDVDGQRATGELEEIRPLTEGRWILSVRAFSEVAGQTSSKGTGSALVETVALRALPDPNEVPDVDVVSTPMVAMPENVLPAIQEVGPGRATWMAVEPVPSGGAVTMALDVGQPGRVIHWSVHSAGVTTIPAPTDPLTGTPIEQGPLGGIQWQRQDQTPLTAFDDGFIVVTLNLDADRREGIVVAFYDPIQGGAATFLLPTSNDRGRISDFSVDDGFASATLDGTGTPEAYLVTRNPGVRDAQILHRATVLPDGSVGWPASITRDEGITGYQVLALWRDPDGSYATHTILQRGIDARLDLPTLGAGQKATFDLVLANPSTIDADIGGQYTVLGPDGKLAGEAFSVLPGSEIRRPMSVIPPQPGTIGLEIRIDSPELLYTHTVHAPVLTRDAFDQEQKEWYDPGKYVPGPAPALLLLGLAFMARRKR